MVIFMDESSKRVSPVVSNGYFELNSPLAHGRILHRMHSSSKALVSLAQKVRGEWKENVYSVDRLLEILPAFSGATDVYISQNRFWRWRSVSRLAELSTMYADLDYYHRSNLAGMPVVGVLEEALTELGRAQIPRPSFATSTGRGLALVWLHNSVPRSELPKWNLCQTHIWRALRDLGADRAATDAARVLRLVGTFNSRSGSIVQTLWEDLDYTWEFEDLAKEILPSALYESLSTVEKREADLGQRLASRTPENPQRRTFPKSGMTVRTLNEARLRDLHKLMDLRGQRRLPPGKRDSWMLVAAASLSRLVKPEYLEREVYKLAEEVAGWSENETKSRMQQVFVRAKAAARDEKVVWQESMRDPRYNFTNQRIIEDLNITPEEEQKLETIISKPTKRQRDKERKEVQRRSQDIKPRHEYIEQTKRNRQMVTKLHKRGYSNLEIAQRTGYSPRHVARIVSGA